jgi:O-methyltransferase involved in polyketide biosynthesis
MPGTTAPSSRRLTPGDRQRLLLQGEQRTLAIPLYAKAMDFRSKRSILKDELASQLVDRIDFDFASIQSRAGGLLVLRARQLDEWIREFLAEQPEPVVLNLGCGLDTRIARIDPPASVSWFDIDFPEVIQLRRSFFAEAEGYRMLGSSITQPDWLTQIPRHRPVIIVADGVLGYLAPRDVKILLNRLTDNFHHGRIVFEVLNSYAVRSANERIGARTGATVKWGVDDLREVDALDPKLRRTDAIPLLGSKFVPSRYRLLYGFLFLFPRLRNSMRVLRFEF